MGTYKYWWTHAKDESYTPDERYCWYENACNHLEGEVVFLRKEIEQLIEQLKGILARHPIIDDETDYIDVEEVKKF
jgi:hypothetical protein